MELDIGAAALENCIQWQEHTANNIASASLPGRKQEIVTIESVTSESFGAQMTMPKMVTSTDFTAGKPYATGNPTDLAIEGDEGFFSLDDGKALSRDGEFRWNESHQLVDKYGHVVDGASGPIVRNPSNGPAAFDRSGGVYQGDQEIGKIALVKVQDKSGLTRNGPVFTAGAGVSVDKMDASEVRVMPEALEKANRTNVKEMVSLMQMSNSTQALQGMIKQADARTAGIIQGLSRS